MKFLQSVWCVSDGDVEEQCCSEATQRSRFVEGDVPPEANIENNWYGDFLPKSPYPEDGVAPLVHGYYPPVQTVKPGDRLLEWLMYAQWFEDEPLMDVLTDKCLREISISNMDCLDIDNLIGSLLILNKNKR